MEKKLPTFIVNTYTTEIEVECDKRPPPVGVTYWKEKAETRPVAEKVQTMSGMQATLRKEYVRVVKWVRALSLILVAPVRIPVVCQSML